MSPGFSWSAGKEGAAASWVGKAVEGGLWTHSRDRSPVWSALSLRSPGTTQVMNVAGDRSPCLGQGVGGVSGLQEATRTSL